MILVKPIAIRLPAGEVLIHIGEGLVQNLGKTLRSMNCGQHAVVLSNRSILAQTGKPVLAALRRGRFPVSTILIPDTERSKSFSGLHRLLVQMTALERPGKPIFLVLLGGGVVGDLGGLAAGLYRRGIPYVQIPTTLLAQVDSSMGGKTAVDLPQGKNLVGLFYHPRLVLMELGFLKTLPDRQFRSGLAEVAKCGVIRDPQLFGFLEKKSFKDIRNSLAHQAWIIERSVRVKARVVEQDERETLSIRTILNFGHTLGHALEAATHYSRKYTHGEAIAIGMVAATRMARCLSMISSPCAQRIERLMEKLGFSTRIQGVALGRIWQAMAHDKKWVSGAHRWVLPKGIGQVVVKEVPSGVAYEVVRGLME